MGLIFLSYRRVDSADATGRIYDRLVQAYGEQSIFKDVDSIPIGANFKATIIDTVCKCDVVLVIMGRSWLNVVDKAGNRRIDSPKDAVRIEVEAALANNKQIIPIFVQNATMPDPSKLPAALRDLSFRNGIPVRPDPDFHRDMDRLISSIGPVFSSIVPASSPPSTTQITDLSAEQCQAMLKLMYQLVNCWTKREKEGAGIAIFLGVVCGLILIFSCAGVVGNSMAEGKVPAPVIAICVILVACIVGPLPGLYFWFGHQRAVAEIERAIEITQNAIVELHPNIIRSWGGRTILDDPGKVQEKILIMEQIVNQNPGFIRNLFKKLF